MKIINLTDDEIILLKRLLNETEFGGPLSVVSAVVKLSTSILEKLEAPVDESSSA